MDRHFNVFNVINELHGIITDYINILKRNTNKGGALNATHYLKRAGLKFLQTEAQAYPYDDLSNEIITKGHFFIYTSFMVNDANNQADREALLFIAKDFKKGLNDTGDEINDKVNKA